MGQRTFSLALLVERTKARFTCLISVLAGIVNTFEHLHWKATPIPSFNMKEQIIRCSLSE